MAFSTLNRLFTAASCNQECRISKASLPPSTVNRGTDGITRGFNGRKVEHDNIAHITVVSCHPGESLAGLRMPFQIEGVHAASPDCYARHLLVHEHCPAVGAGTAMLGFHGTLEIVEIAGEHWVSPTSLRRHLPPSSKILVFPAPDLSISTRIPDVDSGTFTIRPKPPVFCAAPGFGSAADVARVWQKPADRQPPARSIRYAPVLGA